MYALMVAMLAGCIAGDTPPRAWHVQQDGKTVWDQSCKKCHGATGTPAAATKKMMPKLPVLDAAVVSTFSVQDVIDAVTNGKGTMKPLAGKLTPQQITAVSNYLFELTKTKPAVKKAAK